MKKTKFGWIAAFFGLVLITGSSAVNAGWPSGRTVKDVTVTSIRQVNLLSQPQVRWLGKGPRPSQQILRLDFSTNADLLALAKSHGYNVTYSIKPCGSKVDDDDVDPFDGVFWNAFRVNEGSVATSEYSAEVAKKTTMHYQIFFRLPPGRPMSGLCFSLSGGNMLGGVLRSNETPLPAAITP